MGKVTKPASCTASGEKKYTCIECNFEKNEPIQASGHNPETAFQHDATHHWHKCRNCDEKIDRKQHTGGTATCTEKAKCGVCGESYGKSDPANHEGGKQKWTTKTATVHEKKWSCCGAVIVTSEAHEWADGVCLECGYGCVHTDSDKNHTCDICSKVYSDHTDTNKDHKCDYCGKNTSSHEDTDKNHICDYCGKVITDHTGGKATCKSKAECDVCTKAYGKLDTDNHTDLKHINAKAATKETEGNTEYWHCGGCNKYYADAAATKEITKADTVTAKLPSEAKSPQTDDNSGVPLCMALLFVGGICTALTVKRKKTY